MVSPAGECSTGYETIESTKIKYDLFSIMNPNKCSRKPAHSTRLFGSLAAICAFAAVPGVADVNESSSEMALDEPPVAGAFRADSDRATGEWGGLRPDLEERGIDINGSFTGDFLANVDGGTETGSTWAGLFDLELEADLEQLLGWKGTSFFTNVFYFHGQDLEENYVGSFDAISNIYSEADFNVFNLYLTQSLADDQVWIKAGQIAVDDDFMISDSAELFVNSTFGPLPTMSGNLSAPEFPLAAPGAVVHYEPVDGWFLQGAVYAGDAGEEDSGNRGFDWRTGGQAGWVWFAELGHENDWLAGGVVKLGGFHASGEFENFKTGANERGLGSVYAVIDQQLRDSSNGIPGTSLFLRGGFVPNDDLAVVNGYVDGGVVFNDVVMEDDAFGLGISHIFFGDKYVDSVRAGGETATSSQTIIEATAQFPLSGWLTVQPDIQYVIDPHFSGENALILGVRGSMTF